MGGGGKKRTFDQRWKHAKESGYISRFEVIASAQTESRRSMIGQSFAQFVENVGAEQHMRSGRALTATRQAVAQTLRSLRDDPCWTSGTPLHYDEGGLKPCLVEKFCGDKSDAMVKQLCDRAFEYDDRVIPNDRKTSMVPCTVSKHSFGGLCARLVQHSLIECSKILVSH